jgi:DNA-binding beta-propeller fold protein YncE
MRFVIGLALIGAALGTPRLPAQQEQRHLYVALPGSDDAEPDRSIRILVFDITNAHRLVRRIPLWPAARGDDAEAVRGTAANVRTGRFYISTTRRLAAIDLKTDTIVWERSYEGRGCDRIAVSTDGQTIYAPAFGSAKWYVIHAATGELRAAISVTGWPRETMYSRDGSRAYLAAWESPMLSVSDAASHEVVKAVGPFSASLCAFTVNAKGTLAFANIDGLVGFEVGDLETGLILDRVAAEGYDKDAAAKYECPSHGIAFTPDERELWVADGVRNRLQVFDARVYPPVALKVIELPAQPRWIVFSIDGRYAYASTGDVVGAATRTIVGALEDPAGKKVASENLLEIDFVDGQPIRSAASGLEKIPEPAD